MKRKRIKKQLLAAVILGEMLCMLLPTGVWAVGPRLRVRYIDENGMERLAEAEVIKSWTMFNDGWYVTDGDLSLECITVSGHARLILADDKTLTVTGRAMDAAVTVKDGSTLTIYGQSHGTGRLVATGGLCGAGIGGGNHDKGGIINIFGGIVDATGGNSAAGIGGGNGCDGGTINISGGTVDAIGGNLAAGIGGGNGGNGGTINIWGGIVDATGGNDAAGIGGGDYGDGGTINISGGTVTATSSDAEAVGRGDGGTDKTVTIAPPLDVPLYVYVGDAAPGTLLAGSPFTASTSYTGTDRYFHLRKNPLPSGGQSLGTTPGTTPGTLTDSGTGIGVSGAFRSGTTMTVGDILMHEPGECPACDAIRAAQHDSDLKHVLWMDISLSRDCDGPFTVTIPVGTAYEGETLNILHCADEGLETYTAVVWEGKITFAVESLSPFAVYTSGVLDDIPITGDTGSGLIWWLLCGLSAAGMLLWRRKRNVSRQQTVK